MPLAQSKPYTYQDYLQWQDGERWELIGGVPYNMSPAPSTVHQRIALNLSVKLYQALQGQLCEVFQAPTDVVLAESDVVQPDVLVVCNPSKISKRGIMGAPELVVEITSPESSKRDRWDKKALYEKHGVREYLIIDAEGRYIEQYRLDEAGVFSKGQVFSDDQTITLRTLENLALPVSEVFDLGVVDRSE